MAKRTNHITETFFYEELSNIVGCEASYEWLQATNAKKRKCVSSTIPSSQASKQTTPQPSAATTPRRLSLIQSCPLCVSSDAPEMLDQVPLATEAADDATEPEAQARQKRQKLTAESVTLEKTPEQKVDLSATIASCPQIHHQRRQSVCGPTESGTLDRFGLLYTDAAHAVLEGRDIAHFIEHTIRGPVS
jgi:hypothetical protein